MCLPGKLLRGEEVNFVLVDNYGSSKKQPLLTQRQGLCIDGRPKCLYRKTEKHHHPSGVAGRTRGVGGGEWGGESDGRVPPSPPPPTAPKSDKEKLYLQYGLTILTNNRRRKKQQKNNNSQNNGYVKRSPTSWNVNAFYPFEKQQNSNKNWLYQTLYD